MCGRYYIDDGMQEEIRKILKNIDLKLKLEEHREVYPTNQAPIISGGTGQLALTELSWGFQHWEPKKGVLINARAETVLERKMFKDSVMNRRCVIPVTGFYEWDKHKTKIAFADPMRPVLYLAGFWKEERFIILTTEANVSIADVHHRMPLTLKEDEIENWLYEPEAYKLILSKVPGGLERKTAN